jgi:hypothetical protein
LNHINRHSRLNKTKQKMPVAHSKRLRKNNADNLGRTGNAFEYLAGTTKGRMGRIFRLREDVVPGTSLGL